MLMMYKCSKQEFQRFVLSQLVKVGSLTSVWVSSFDGFRTSRLLEMLEISQLIEENKIPEFGQ